MISDLPTILDIGAIGPKRFESSPSAAVHVETKRMLEKIVSDTSFWRPGRRDDCAEVHPDKCAYPSHRAI
jgi:hypothetical protein